MPASKTLLVAGLLLAALGTGGERDGGEGEGASRAEARTIAGTISAFAWTESRLTVDTPGGPVTLELDRNTAVFLENRLGSVHDLVVGTPVRASFGGDRRAVWVEVHSRATASGVGREPDDGGPPVPAGPPPPEPDSGIRPPRPPQPGPSGPGPVPDGSER